ncbi:MAG TPA: sulfite reductase subunit alpha [Opitutaceae bacterium]|nr:sulfite reductase subunit alpha [Opitutaceae bacterium]
MQNFVPVLPESAPFTAEQRAYLNGFLAGLCSRVQVAGSAPALAAAAPAPQALTPLTILFGSQTGTAENLAKKLSKEAGKRGFAPTVLDMSQIDLGRLAAEKNVLVITSTYGDGEPPDNTKALWTALGNAEGSPLVSLRFSVCGLGDTNYVQFCKCAKDFDARLEKLGAKRLAERVDCDLDYDEKFTRWMDGALGALGQNSGGATASPAATTATPASAPAEKKEESGYSRKNPFSAVVRASRVLNAEGSAKEVRHVEFDLETSGLVYEAGDALGVFPQNCPELVGEVLALLGCDGEEAVTLSDGITTSLRHALTAHYDLGKPTAELVSEYALRRPAAGNTATLVAPHHVVDVLHAYAEVKLTPAEFVAKLKKIQPRLYSISSSPIAHKGHVHLTVGAVRYDLNGKARKGVCSTYLADRVTVGETRVGVFVHSNKAFRPPTNNDLPMIMVGPGTGIAPFRGFLHERKARGAKGKNWLFFGDQRASTDFLYREELSQLQAEGVLSRLDTAFSRDQAEKVYVQNRMLENAAELFAWLEAGAHFYVCGDASRMAKDVDAALHKVIEAAGKKTPEQAAAYVEQLKTTKRYARDVY